MFDFRNATFNAVGTIDCEINHPKFGWIPFTATQAEDAAFYAAVEAVATAYAAPTYTLGESQAAKLADLKSKRTLVENGGTTLAGKAIATDEKTRAVMTAAYVRAINDVTFSVSDYKSASGGFVSLSNAEIIAIALQIEAHVQACFTKRS